MDLELTSGPNSLPRPGSVLRERWQIVRRIGEGGTAQVFEAVHRNGRRGAIKLLRKEWSRNPEAIERFRHEGMLANLVLHPGIVASLDDDVTEEGTPFLVMELLEGETLDDKLERCPERRLATTEACRIGIAMLDVLAAVHDAGIIHRDLKPDNLFLTNEGQLKLLDFGIARAEQTPGTHTNRLGVAMGTPGYMPVEQAAGDWENVDARTDVWAAGAVLFRMVTGTCVYEEDTITKTLCVAMTSGAPPVAHRAPRVPLEVAAVIDRALRVHPSDRWQTAADMKEALEAALAELELNEEQWFASNAELETRRSSIPGDVSPKTSRAGRDSARPSRHRRNAAWLGVAGSLVVSIALLGFAGSRMSAPRHEPAHAADAHPDKTMSVDAVPPEPRDARESLDEAAPSATPSVSAPSAR